MRALLLAAALVGCGGEAARAPVNPNTCMVWVTPPSSLPVLWTCTSGTAAAFSDGRPDHVACVESTDPLWTMIDGGTAVPSCQVCVPAELLRLDPQARCTPLGEPETPKWLPGDMVLPVSSW